MATKAEMHEQSRDQTRQLTTLIRSSSNLRLILRELLPAIIGRLGEVLEGPLKKHLTVSTLMARLDNQQRSSVLRTLRQHAPQTEGGTKTVQFWSRPGADAFGEFDADDDYSLVVTQEFARVLVPLVLVGSNREFPCHRLRAALSLSESSWSNIVTSFLPEEQVGDWPGQCNWRGKVSMRGEKTVRSPKYLSPPQRGVTLLRSVFGDHLDDILDVSIIPEADDLVALGLMA